MTVTDERSIDPNGESDDRARRDMSAIGVNWDLEPLLDGAADVDELLDRADVITDELVADGRGRIAQMTAAELGAFYAKYSTMIELSSRAGNYASLVFAADTAKPENGALMAHVEERSTATSTKLIFIDLEWAAASDDHVDAVLSDPAQGLDFVRHYLRSQRRYRQHVLTEPEERILTEKSVTGSSAWGRLYDEVSAAMEVDLVQADGATQTVPLMQGLAMLQHPDRGIRVGAHEAITRGLQPGLRTRAFIFNTLVNDKQVDDRLRTYRSWISSRNLANEASDESVQALVDSVVARYDIPQRWYTLKAKILGVDTIADYDRMASVAVAETHVPWSAATETVIDAYSSFSGELAGIVQRFLREDWIDAPANPGKRGGAFCAYTVPSHHPYVLLNWTSKTRDVATLAHELGHGVHGYLARQQGVFQMTTPLTLAETASVFGETVTSKRLLSTLSDPNERLALLAATLEDSIATVFRQVSMNRFEHSVHEARRNEGELAVERFNELWEASQAPLFGPSVQITEGYRIWWSYIPHFIHTPGYVYAYAYGQLLALSVYKRYEEIGDEFVPRYLDLLRAGGSMSPQDLGRIVDCDLADPEFWDGGLAIVDEQLTAAEDAAAAAGRI
jgi:oligoendopeptidase F